MSELTPNEVAVFNTARRLGGDERAACLEEACAGNSAMRRRIEELLQVDEAAGGFLEKPAQADPTVLAILGESVRSSLPLSEKPGDRIGPYKLLEKVGEGGCGVVYVAEQTEPVRRRVALKVIKLGMDTRAVVARFEAERQALAMMDHPNIARVLDAGTTETGRPYFVMELVRGIRITDYCDQANLNTQERLDLFIKVCRAIQHAHQKGIIHRDIKPSNILVTLHDGVPVPKVIDFGIAKATEGRLTDATVYTQLHQFIGTPAYMSPEQAEMSGLDIDTRSDIYSLGVLLYELLAGSTPFDAQALMAAGIDAMRKTIREQEPVRPSTRLATLQGEALTTAARHRSAEAPKLIHLLKGDLDWIVMKCLEKDRTRRYETANGLAADLKRHLENEPVVARPPSATYRFQKAWRRHQTAFAAGIAVFFALAIGLGFSVWLLAREKQAHREAEEARARESILRHKAEAGERTVRAKYLFDSYKFTEAEKLLNEGSPAFEHDSIQADVQRGLGWWHSLHERWTEAAANFGVLLRVDVPEDWSSYSLDCLMYGPTLLQFGDTNRYEDFRNGALARFSTTTNAIIAERISRACLLLPADEKVTRQMGNLYNLVAQSQADATANADMRAWACVALGIMDYRRNNYEKSVEWCQLCLKSPKKVGRTAVAQAILAMAFQQLHRNAEARTALAQARASNTRTALYRTILHDNTALNFVVLFDGVYAATLLREAGALIEDRPAAEDSAYAAARCFLASMYASGQGMPKDLPEAVKWYRKAADQGFALAQETLGRMYANGEGVPKDMVGAVNWYRKAADQGSASAQNLLGALYANGEGVAKDQVEAAKWYREAANSGDALALNNLAWLLATSPDAKLRNGTEAIILAEKAAAATNRKEPVYLDTLSAAYAEVGQFDKAVSVQQEAIALLKTEEEKKDYASRLKLYESHLPYRENK